MNFSAFIVIWVVVMTPFWVVGDPDPDPAQQEAENNLWRLEGGYLGERINAYELYLDDILDNENLNGRNLLAHARYRFIRFPVYREHDCIGVIAIRKKDDDYAYTNISGPSDVMREFLDLRNSLKPRVELETITLWDCCGVYFVSHKKMDARKYYPMGKTPNFILHGSLSGDLEIGPPVNAKKAFSLIIREAGRERAIKLSN